MTRRVRPSVESYEVVTDSLIEFFFIIYWYSKFCFMVVSTPIDHSQWITITFYQIYTIILSATVIFCSM